MKRMTQGFATVAFDRDGCACLAEGRNEAVIGTRIKSPTPTCFPASVARWLYGSFATEFVWRREHSQIVGCRSASC